ncbi:hypothetical protein [Vulcanisaeta sp. JCM 16161]|uniref:hypothetical protein n=1 Tax=Vulcanisaeta sp. JCM 16161 TaxID=1295372 RepID=UPI000B308AD3|nr:hypothetical protein [Vulcanisaeta sp. JCM 16161]
MNVIKQLNNTLPQIMRSDACLIITNPINYSCNTIAENLTETLNEALSSISNETNNAVRYRVIYYEIYGEDNETIYRAVIQAITQTNSVEDAIIVTYPFNLCYYSQAINNLINGMGVNVTIHANNVTQAVQDINNYLTSKIGSSHFGINITLDYVGVFRMIERARNYTIYWGSIDYVLRASPREELCNGGLELGGSFYVAVIISAYVNNTYYFAVSGVINNDE